MQFTHCLRLIIASSLALSTQSHAHSGSILSNQIVQTLLICALILIMLQATFLVILSRRNFRNLDEEKKASEAQPQILAKTKRQLYVEIARHEETEELLRETQEYMHCMINSMPSIVVGITTDGHVTHWNRAAQLSTKLAPSQALNRHVNHVLPDLPITREIIEKTIGSSQPYSQKNIRKGDGSNATYTDLTVYPLVAPDISGAVILADDVTLRVRVENTMIQNEKMLSLGEMAAGMAHEINNPLAGILNNTQNIIRRTSGGLPANQKTADTLDIPLEKIQQYLEARGIQAMIKNIREAGERAAKIVTNMLEFSRGNDRNHSYTDITAVVKHTLELAADKFEFDAGATVELPKITIEVSENIPQIPCSPTEIQQVVINLLRNAAQAFQTGGRDATDEPVVTIRIFHNMESVVIEVSDNGPGIPDSVSRHIFEPFFTTKEVGQGTGLGLSVSYFIITEHHNGTIEMETTLGQGTTFTISLPIHPSNRQDLLEEDTPVAPSAKRAQN